MSQVDLKSYQAQLVKARDSIIKDTDTDKERIIEILDWILTRLDIL